MRTTDFAHCLATYLTVYLPGQLGLSENTIMSYRDTFKLVLLFAEQHFHLRPEKITLSDFNMDFITAFLFWLEQERGCCIATRNQRLAALRAFAQYARSQYPAYLLESQKSWIQGGKNRPYQLLPTYLLTMWQASLNNLIQQQNMAGGIWFYSV